MRVREFLKMQDPEQLAGLKAITKYVVAKNCLGKKSTQKLTKYPFKKVEELKELFSEGKIIELMCFLLSCNQRYILRRDYKEFVYFLRWIEKEFQNINRLEIELNRPKEGDEKMMMQLEQAGAESLNKFGILNTIDSLANGDILKWGEVESLPYEMVYTKLLLNKEKAAVERNYNQIIIEENKGSNG